MPEGPVGLHAGPHVELHLPTAEGGWAGQRSDRFRINSALSRSIILFRLLSSLRGTYRNGSRAAAAESNLII